MFPEIFIYERIRVSLLLNIIVTSEYLNECAYSTDNSLFVFFLYYINAFKYYYTNYKF